MNKAIIQQWNSQVSPNDEVYFQGDFGINKKRAIDPYFVNQLNGIKYIILGNHDFGFVRSHKNKEKFESVRRKYIQSGWQDAFLCHELTLKDGTKCTLTHLPPDNNNDSRYREFKIEKNQSLIHLHGHLHGWWRKKDNMIDVCFDADLKLLSEDDLINIKNDPRDHIETRLTAKYKNEIPLMLMPFEDEVKKRNIRRSDMGNLCIYNYTDQCTYDRAWNEITRVSRGIIFEKDTGRLIACSFPKFFNIGEMPETRIENLPDEDYEVYEKMDGSLGIIYNYNDKWSVATRGSLNSDQAIKAQEILKKYDLSGIPKHYTLLAEIIYPENKIVVDYGDKEELVLLAVNDLSKEEELPRHRVSAISFSTGMPLCKAYNYTIDEMIELKKTIPKDDEGFIVKYKSGLRVKIKGDEYLRIHKLISQLSPISLWECMENGKVKQDYLQELPEEYRKEVDQMVKVLEEKYINTYFESKKEYMYYRDEILAQQSHLTRKDLRLCIKTFKPKYSHLFFAYLDDKIEQIDKSIMRMIRPNANKLEE